MAAAKTAAAGISPAAQDPLDEIPPADDPAQADPWPRDLTIRNHGTFPVSCSVTGVLLAPGESVVRTVDSQGSFEALREPILAALAATGQPEQSVAFDGLPA